MKKKEIPLETMIETTLSEFCDCYILVGFDENGNEIICRKVNSDKDVDALQTYLEKVVDEMHSDEFEEIFVEEEEEDDKDA